MFTADAVVDHVREILQDRDGDRYPTDSLLKCLDEALTELRRLRPDFFIGRFHAEGTSTVPEGTNREINLPVFLFSPLVNYTAGMAEMRDDEFTTDGRAVALMTMFRQQLGGQ